MRHQVLNDFIRLLEFVIVELRSRIYDLIANLLRLKAMCPFQSENRRYSCPSVDGVSFSEILSKY